MEIHELLRVVAGTLERLGVRYFVTGSVATIFYGEPRFTNDIDMVADLQASQALQFSHAFATDEYYVSLDAIRRAIRDRSQFNIIHPKSGLKADLLIPTLDAFDESRFRRANQVQPATDLQVCFSSPEDVILKKMQYYRLGGSDKHLRDITGILRVEGDALEFDYLDRWAKELEVESIWQAIRLRLEEG